MSCHILLNELSIKSRLSKVSAEVDPQGITCLLGPNGAGKSTLLMVMAGLLTPDAGAVYWNDEDIASLELAALAQTRAYLSQQQSVQFELTGRECLQYTAISSGDMIPAELVEKLDLLTLLDKPVTRMSGGEQQRIMIARTLLQVWQSLQKGQALLILDEPLQGLDIFHQMTIMGWFETLAAQGNQIILSCHDINIANMFANTVWFAKAGKLLAIGPTSEVLNLPNLRLTFDCQFERLEKDERYFYCPVHPR